ncbi:nucleotide-diphospho-sugar transferase [Mycena alexandri]|uniref:Dolichol-phosphate mannosyltransferase subunit 1 n=1 Tax=Mycena alexandri TaxID=1745969 RepID=A0AAD6SDF8_9AGAR|nr:nucleotide-diphospho-sugar transferase [Mycena alexandri]
MRARQPRRPTPRRLLIGGLFLLVVVYYLFFSGSSDDELYHPAERVAARATNRTGSSSSSANSDSKSNNTKIDIMNSIIVPTFHERPNIRPLVTAVFGALPADLRSQTELIIVDDDSQDGTADVVEELWEEDGSYDKGYVNVVLVVRTKVEGTGLSSAVLRGFEEARGESLVVMDADLQHPPSTLPTFFAALANPATPFVIGTRYAPGTKINANWPLYRRLISWGARSLARPLTSASDPMSGFFGMRRELFLASQPLTATGFKIGLELLLKAPIREFSEEHGGNGGLKEFGYSFGVRSEGSSKLGAKVMFRYLLHLAALYRWRLGHIFPVLLILLALVTLWAAALGLAMALIILRRVGFGIGSESMDRLESLMEWLGLEGVLRVADRWGGDIGARVGGGGGMGSRGEREREKDRERRRRVRGEV